MPVDPPPPPGSSCQLLDGRSLSAAWLEALSREARDVALRRGHPPGLGVVLVGARPDSELYVSRKAEACAQAGVDCRIRRLPAQSSEAELQEAVRQLCAEEALDGVLLQLPLPEHMREDAVIEAFDPDKDIDGFHPLNMGRVLMRGRAVRFVPATALGCMRLLAESGHEIEGRTVVILGDSNIVGMPLAALMRDAGAATVTVVHRNSYSGLFSGAGEAASSQSKGEVGADDGAIDAEDCRAFAPYPDPTPAAQQCAASAALERASGSILHSDPHGTFSPASPPPGLMAQQARHLAGMTRTADVLVVAVGHPELVRGDWVKPGAVVLDVGVNVVERRGRSWVPSRQSWPGLEAARGRGLRLAGDVHWEEVSHVARALTPVPGGVGPMTVAATLANVVRSARLRCEGGNGAWS